MSKGPGLSSSDIGKKAKDPLTKDCGYDQKFNVSTYSDAGIDGHDSEDTKQSTADMTAFVQNLLQQMQSRFQTMSENIISKIDEMGNRINELEQSINELKAEMGAEGTSPLASSKVNVEESKGELPAGGST